MEDGPALTFPPVSIFLQDDWANYAPFTADVGTKIQVVGDDLLVTNPKRIKEAAQKKACNALLLKVCACVKGGGGELGLQMCGRQRLTTHRICTYVLTGQPNRHCD